MITDIYKFLGVIGGITKQKKNQGQHYLPKQQAAIPFQKKKP